MRLFVDANIIVSVLLKEYPLFTHSARVLSLANYKGFRVYTSPICLAIAWYFTEKKKGPKVASDKLRLLCQHLHIAPATVESMANVLADKKVNDFEDGLQYYAAVAAGCNHIVTENVSDFYFSTIPVSSAKDFLEHYLLTIA